MPAQNLKGLFAALVPTENPDEDLLAVFISRDRVDFDKPLPKLGTKLRDFAYKDEALIRLFGDWIYLNTKDRQTAGDGSIGMSFTFGRPWTAAELAAPKPFRSTWNNEEGVDWPPVLERMPSGKVIDFTEDANFPFNKLLGDGVTSVTTPRVLVDWALRDRWTGKTLVRTDLYLSPVPWGPETMAFDEPMPQPVRWNQTTTSESFEACLHGEIIIPAFGATTRQVGSTTSQTPPLTEGKIIPATNMESWEDRYVNKREDYIDGMYLYTFKWGIAPPKHPIVSRLL